MHLLGGPDHDAHRREGIGPGPPQLACPRRVAHIGRPPEDQYLESGGIHGVEDGPTSVLAESREVDAATLFEGHDPGHCATPITVPPRSLCRPERVVAEPAELDP